jgi:protein involved in polysaccharide export with SLBB domain
MKIIRFLKLEKIMNYKICILPLLIFFISSCSNMMPGLHNPDLSHRPVHEEKTSIEPTLVLITPQLIIEQNHSTYDYQIAPSDIVNITVWQHPEFSPKNFQTTSTPSAQGAAGQDGYLVSNKGYIYFPLAGNILVAGKTLEEVRIDITKALKRYIRDPQINVRIADYRGQKIYVFGEIMKPGFIPITDQPLSITDAISLSGSFDPTAADPSHIYVIRGNILHPIIYWLDAKTPDKLLLAERFMLKPGDVLYISSAAATRWNRVINQLLPSVQTLWYTKAIVNNN